jgi:phenylacetate-CoA oxygenase PaaH subunit
MSSPADGVPGGGVPGGGVPAGGAPGVSGAGEAGGGQGDVYEVFRQERDGGPMRHAGNLRAPDPELAAHYAREFYSRRQESFRLWVVKRSEIREIDDPDLLRPPLDRSFKKPPGYSGDIKRKLAEARELVARELPAEAREGAT